MDAIRGDLTPWTKTSERRPTDVPGEQRDVLYGSSDWGWAILGMYTHWPDAEVAKGASRWQVYDQLNDRYDDYVLSTEPEPEFWMYRPKLPGVETQASLDGERTA